jgi:hypothetical protein
MVNGSVRQYYELSFACVSLRSSDVSSALKPTLADNELAAAVSAAQTPHGHPSIGAEVPHPLRSRIRFLNQAPLRNPVVRESDLHVKFFFRAAEM